MSNLLAERWLRLAFAEDSTTVQLVEAHGNSKIYDKCQKGWKRHPDVAKGKMKKSDKGSCIPANESDEALQETENNLWNNIRGAQEKPKNQRNHPNSKAYQKAKKAAQKINKEEKNESDELMEVDESNPFVYAAAAAKKDKKDKFEFGGKEYDVDIDEETAEEIMGEAALRSLIRNLIMEAVYNGRKVTLNKPMSNPENKKKKSKVYVNSGKKIKSGKHKGQVRAKKVQFGQAGVKIKKNNPKKRANFRKRHNCKNPGPKDKARYWSCRAW